MKEVIVKEVIELLKKALKEKSKIEPDYSEHTIKLAADMMMVYIEEALALLRPCGTCGGSKRKPREKHCKLGMCVMQHEGITCSPDGAVCIHYIPTEPCPDCQGSADGTIDVETLKKIDKACGDKLSHDEPAEKPPASELTKECRELIYECSHGVWTNVEGSNFLIQKLEKACDRLDAEINNNVAVRNAAKKLSQCFPKRIEGQEQKFDIPRYVIDELEGSLERITSDDSVVDKLTHEAYMRGRTKGFENGKRNADDLEAKLKNIEAQYKELDKHSEQLEAKLKETEAENKQLKGEEPMPGAWWKDCPNLAQKTMERIIHRNDELEAKLKQQGEQNEALMNRPASIECPKCHTIIKAV